MDMKRKRHSMILKLIEEYSVSKQEELLELLCKNGFDVTQATVSRDIKELKLVKTTDKNGKYCYSYQNDNNNESKNYNTILSTSVISVRKACNMVCVLCNTGTAQAVCFAIDELKLNQIIGTIAGDDTIFIMCESDSDAIIVSEKIKKLSLDEKR